MEQREQGADDGRRGRRWVPAACALVVLLALTIIHAAWLDAVKLRAFCLPVGWLAAWLTGGALEVGDEAIIVTTERLRLVLPPGCSGFTFFLILSMTIVVNHGWGASLKPLILVYPVTLLTNLLRILAVGSWTLHVENRLPLPHPFQHLLVGMAVFLPSLLLFYALSLYGGRRKLNMSPPEDVGE